MSLVTQRHEQGPHHFAGRDEKPHGRPARASAHSAVSGIAHHHRWWSRCRAIHADENAGTATAIDGDVSAVVCLHCHAAAAIDDVDGFCCVGCRAAYAFITAAGLQRYQLLADGPLPRGGTPAARPWLPALLSSSPTRITVDVQGLTCGACVWVLQKIAERRCVAVLVNPGVGRVEIDASDVDTINGFLDDIETLGYRTGPPLKQGDVAADGLVLRAGVCGGLAMAAMSFAFARYFGLHDGVLSSAFFLGEFISASAALVVGGGPFFVGAWRALRMGIASFDLPIAVGLFLAFVGSVASVVSGDHDGVFFDSVAMFAALMIVGRLAQRSVLVKSRAQLLNDNGLAGLPVTIIVDEVPTSSTAEAVRAGDRLLVRPGDAVVVAAQLVSGQAPFSLAWITGEAEEQTFRADDDDVVPAGACHVGDRAVVVVAVEAGTDSRLASLLSRHDDDDIVVVEGWARFARVSVLSVLALAATALVVWSALVGVGRGLSVATALLVVTCPCALGLALPLADELGLAALRRRGVFVRRGGFFARLQKITDVVFDKTGTLTVGVVALDDDSRAAVAALDAVAADVLFQMAARSAHPKSRALVTSLVDQRWRDAVVVSEVAGVGLFATDDGVVWALRNDGDELGFFRGDRQLLTLRFSERLQSDALVQVRALQRRGLRVHLASGDAAARAQRVGVALGIDAVRGGLSPEDKADLVETIGADHVCFVGDGINDAAAFAVAGIAGTPALDRPQLPARADFYTVSAGLGPIDAIFRVGTAHARATSTALRFSIAYNVVVIVAALCGVLTPLWCALLMPASSVLVVLLVRAAFTQQAQRMENS